MGILCKSFNLDRLIALVFTFYSIHMPSVLETNWLVKNQLTSLCSVLLLDEADENNILIGSTLL